jgi:hypothetical protein
MSFYLHCFDLSNKLKLLNFASTGTYSSLFVTQMITRDTKPNPMHVDIEKLQDCTIDEIDGISSPVMLFVFQKTVFESFTRKLTKQEQSIIKRANVEIEFERGRRLYNYAAPSRLSAIFLTENTDDDRANLFEMFSHLFRNPKILEVSLFNDFEKMKFDYRWYEKYHEDAKEEYIKNYWEQQPFELKIDKWEILLEGTIKIINKVDFDELNEFVKDKLPDEYDGILQTREQLEAR